LAVNSQPPAPARQEASQRIADRLCVEVPGEDEKPSAGLRGKEHRESDGADILDSVPPLDVASAAADRQGLPWMTALAWGWVAGITLVASGQAWRILRLRRLLRDAIPAPPALLSMAKGIGRRLGLSRTPEVRMVSLRLSPMVWSPVGRPRLVLPAALFARLDVPAQEVIVAHELAHIRRRDHWVRLLELTISTLFWWHPVAWWAGRALRELEEHCCDGMVLGAVPHGGRAYATALVDTLDYLSEKPLSLPSVATGANSLGSLSRRIKMLKNPPPVRPLTVGRLLLLLAVAAVPMAVAFAARPSPADDRPRSGDYKQDQEQDRLVDQAGNKATGEPAAAKPPGTRNPAKAQKGENMQYATWRMAVSLRATNQLPSAVQWAIVDHDPVPAFKARLKKLRWIYREQLRRAKNGAAKENTRKGWMTVQWDSGFKEISGDRLYLLTSDHLHPLTSNGPDGKKWVVTKVRMTKGKPVCWCVPVELKYGEEVKVTLTEKNVLDLGAAIDTALREGASSPEEQRMEEWSRKTWRIQLSLRVRGSAPLEVSYAMFDEDPVPAFKASVKKWQSKNGSVSGEERRAVRAAAWDGVFKRVPGNRLYQLQSRGVQALASNAPDGKKWIVTKVVQIKGKAFCWSVPVKVKTGNDITVTLTEDKAFDLESAFDSALRERGPTK
jgi:beta-lactamase regulating signal transducer with metallopeptidase domain